MDKPATWRKPSRSMGAGECVEVTAWRKPKRSFSNGQCVEIGQGSSMIGVRDSKDPSGPVLTIGTGGWAAFLSSLRD